MNPSIYKTKNKIVRHTQMLAKPEQSKQKCRTLAISLPLITQQKKGVKIHRKPNDPGRFECGRYVDTWMPKWKRRKSESRGKVHRFAGYKKSNKKKARKKRSKEPGNSGTTQTSIGIVYIVVDTSMFFFLFNFFFILC